MKNSIALLTGQVKTMTSLEIAELRFTQIVLGIDPDIDPSNYLYRRGRSNQVFVKESFYEILKPIIQKLDKHQRVFIVMALLSGLCYIEDIVKLFDEYTYSTPAPTVFTYIARDSQTGHVKIGKSKTPTRRVNILRCARPMLSIVFCLNGDFEKELHLKYKQNHIKREWFDLEDIAIAQIRSTYPIAKKY